MNRRTFNYNVKAFVHKHFPDARVSSAGKERIVNCLWHDDSGRHLYINVDKGVYVCFSCGAKGNFYELVKRLSKSGDVSRELAKYVTGNSYEETVEVDKKPFILPKGFFRLAADKLDDKSDSAKRARKYLSNRGFSDSIIYYYRMGHCIGGQFDRRVIVPVHDDYDDLVSFIARDYTGTQEPKVLTPKSEKGSHGVKDHVFNLYQAAKTRHLVITEGVFSALAVGHSGVALFGKKATDVQINKIVSVKPSKVTVMLDSDAKPEAQYLASELFLRIPDVRIARLPYGDPNDVLAHELKESLDNAEQFNGFGDVLECLD